MSWGFFCHPGTGAGGPIRFAESLSSICRRISRARVWARTMPATEFSSAIAMALIPRRAARSTYSSGCDPPVKKVKFEVISSSENAKISFSLVQISRGEAQMRRGAGPLSRAGGAGAWIDVPRARRNQYRFVVGSIFTFCSLRQYHNLARTPEITSSYTARLNGTMSDKT